MTHHLAICIPSRGHVRSDCMQAILAAALDARESTGNVSVVMAHRCHVTQARNEIVEQCLDNDVTEMLWFDDDALPPVDIYERLSQVGRDIVTAVGRRRVPPYKMTAKKVIDGEDATPVYVKPEAAVPISWNGLHCALIQTKVFREMRDHGSVWPAFQTPSPEMGEDVFFCQAAAAHGFETWLLGVEVDHALETTVDQMRKMQDAS